MASDNDIKLEFIRQEIKQHGDWLKRIFLAELDENEHGAGSTDNSFEPIDCDVLRLGNSFQPAFNFLDYGHYFDLHSHQKCKNNDWQSNGNRMEWSKKRNGLRYLILFYICRGEELDADGQKSRKYIHKDNKWHRHNMYGGLGEPVAALLHGLGDENIAEIKSLLQNTLG